MASLEEPFREKYEHFRHFMRHTDQDKTMNFDTRTGKLDFYYKTVQMQILEYQSPTTGLFPALTAASERLVAHVRPSIYCAASLWAMSLAYRKIDNDLGRTVELSQSAVKCMRGILTCWMHQADKVEKFKSSPTPRNALHSKFHLVTGEPLTRDEEYEHLQIDNIALFLLFMIQMIETGLQIIYTTDEVNFIQNLVFYIERTYRTPDYGMWERGSKYNNGSPELNASSIGMAKAALEAINGYNVFGVQGAAWSVIYIDIDAYNRNRTIFETLLPRESASKNTDASLIPTISWPAFATHESDLRKRTMDKIVRKLRGRYGFKRFLRDGFKTSIEDKNRKYYRPAEIKTFDGIECEWPLFFLYLTIENMYFGNEESVAEYKNLLAPLLRETAHGVIIPRYYYVPRDYLDKERADPGCQARLPSVEGGTEGLFLWGQALYIITQLLLEDLVNVIDIDPIRRFLPAGSRLRPSHRYSSFVNAAKDLSVQVVLMSESSRLQQLLATYGIQTQTPHQVEPVQIWSPNTLMKAFLQLGLNDRLGLSGRPARPIGLLGTGKIYRIANTTILCYPLLFEVSDFYLSQDMPLVIDELKNDLSFLSKTWKLRGRPTFCLLIKEDTIRGPQWRDFVDMLSEMKRGEINGVKVRLGRLQEMLGSGCTEHLDFYHGGDGEELDRLEPVRELDSGRDFKALINDQKLQLQEDVVESTDVQALERQSNWDLARTLREKKSFYDKCQILHILVKREGLQYRVDDCTVGEHLEIVAREAGVHQQWSVVRFCSALLRKVVDSLAPSMSSVLVRGRQITLGVFGHEEEVVEKPLSPNEISHILYTKCYPHDIYQAVLQQEMILNIGLFFSVQPELFEGILKVRIGWIIQAMKLELTYSEEEESLYHLAPSAIRQLLHSILSKFDAQDDFRSPIWRRQLDGALNRVPKCFYEKMWEILEKTPGGLKVAGYHLPQQPTLSDMTLYELNFMLLVEQMLSKIVDPAYRQIVVETFMVVATILERNPEVEFPKLVDVDMIIHDSFEEFQRDLSHTSDYEKQDNMHHFFNTPPNIKNGTTSYIAKSVINCLLDGEIGLAADTACVLS